MHFGHTHYAQEIIEALVYEFFQSLLLTDTEATILVMNASYLARIFHECARNLPETYMWQWFQRFSGKCSLYKVDRLANPRLFSATAPGVALPPPSLES